MKKHTISDIAKKFKRSRTAVLSWIEQGFFPGAKLNESGIVPFWEIPEQDLVDFVPPKAGRPTTKPQEGKLAA